MRASYFLVSCLALLCMVGGSAFAGWTVVNLHPAGATYSEAWGVSGGQQVGEADGHAGLWSGTAGSWVDLHALLPAGVYYESSAQSVDVSAGETWVAGYLALHQAKTRRCFGITLCPNPRASSRWGAGCSRSAERFEGGSDQ